MGLPLLISIATNQAFNRRGPFVVFRLKTHRNGITFVPSGTLDFPEGTKVMPLLWVVTSLMPL